MKAWKKRMTENIMGIMFLLVGAMAVEEMSGDA